MNLKLKNEVLEFDRIGVSGEEINEHINFYYENAKEGMNIYKENKKEAFRIFKTINKNLRKEYEYYTKAHFDMNLYCPDESKKYVYYIKEICSKIIRTNSYETLYSNLYDIIDYKKYNITTEFEENQLYGSIWINVINYEIENSDNKDKIKVLQILRNFYLKPNKSKAKNIIKIKSYIIKYNLKEFIVKSFFKKYL